MSFINSFRLRLQEAVEIVFHRPLNVHGDGSFLRRKYKYANNNVNMQKCKYANNNQVLVVIIYVVMSL